MRKSEQKRRHERSVLAGLLATVVTLTCVLLTAALMVWNGRLGDRQLALLLPIGCLLAGIIGAVLASGGRDGSRVTALLLSGAVPSGVLLCLGSTCAAQGGPEKTVFWNAAALLLPPLLALIPHRNKRSRNRNYRV